MSDINYRTMPEKELTERMENGELSKNPDLYAEHKRRMKEFGTSYEYTPEDIERWKKDVEESARKLGIIP